MRAEVIAIGDELTSGIRLDTNSQWLSQQLEQVGIPVDYHTSVGDDMDALVSVIQEALERAHVVLLTGGLGPTADDLTRQAIAAAVNRPLALDPAVLAHIRELFTRRGRTMPERNVVQAEFPKGSGVIANPHGTAPGMHLQVGRETGGTGHLFALPGVPAELKQMWIDSVAPQLIQILGKGRRVIRHRIIRCFGAGESEVEQMLPDLIRRGRQPSVGITASQATISLRVTADGETPEECYKSMQPTVATVYECLGNLVFGEGDDTLQDVVGRLLQEQQLQLATAEWGTQGLLASWMAGAVENGGYRGGVVIASEDLLRRTLGVSASTEDAEPANVARWITEMASQARDRLGAHLGLVVGPCPRRQPAEDSPGRIHFALATPGGVIPASSVFAAHPSIQRQRAAKEALNLTRLWLLKQQG